MSRESHKGKRLDNPKVLLSILDNLPTSIFVKDENLHFVYSNKMHCELIKKPEDELLGHSDADFWPQEDARQFQIHDRQVIESGIVDISEESVPGSDGRKTPLLTRKARLVDEDGKTYLIGTNADLTEVKRREEQYRALSETVPVGIVQIDGDGRIIFSNPLFNSYAGGEDAAEALLEKLKAAHAYFPGSACKFETEFSAMGHGMRSVIVISSGWLSSSALSRTAMISIVDVSEMTELRRVNNEVSRLNRELAENMRRLRDAQEELVQRGRMEQLGQLTATIAHELRNPLGSVRTSAFLLERKARDKGLGIEPQLDRINKGIVRCDHIITQLLDFSRNTQLNCTPGDLDAWLTQVLEEESGKLPAAITIECNLGLANSEVPFDPSRLQRAIVNLLSNASEALVGQGDDPAKFSNAKPVISITTRAISGFIVIEVRDNGPGIPAGVLARIREPLFTTKSFGTGLGVPAIEQIAKQHGGRLEVSTEPGLGATFSIWLPMRVSNVFDNEAVA
jgi:PAS domain S-box-containing protein